MINGAGPGLPDLQGFPAPPRNPVAPAANRQGQFQGAHPDNPPQGALPRQAGPAAAAQQRARVLFAAAGELPHAANGPVPGPLPRPAMPALPFPLPARIIADGPVRGLPLPAGPGLFDFAVVRMPPRENAAVPPLWLPDPLEGASDDESDRSGSTQASSASSQTGLNPGLRARLQRDLEDTASSGAIR